MQVLACVARLALPRRQAWQRARTARLQTCLSWCGQLGTADNAMLTLKVSKAYNVRYTLRYHQHAEGEVYLVGTKTLLHFN